MCGVGTSCSVGSPTPTRCLPGSVAPVERSATCTLCENGKFQREYGQTACDVCVTGFYCKEGTSEPSPCPVGHYGNATGLYSAGQCLPVPIDFWAPLGSPVPKPCPPSGFYCPGALRDELYGGGEPIIMPQGESTQSEEVEAVTKEMTLDISMDDFAAQREQLKIALAAQYGVHVSMISLEAAAATSRRTRALQSSRLQLTITIATTDSSGNAVEMSTLISSVSSFDDQALASTIGGVTGTTVSVTSQPLQTSSVLVTVAFNCPRGHYCSAGEVYPCAAGEYNPHAGNTTGLACLACPDYSMSPPGSENVSACLCTDGFVPSTAADGRQLCVCPAGQYRIYDANAANTDKFKCTPCGPGMYKEGLDDPDAGKIMCKQCPNNMKRSDPLQGATSAAQCRCGAGKFTETYSEDYVGDFSPWLSYTFANGSVSTMPPERWRCVDVLSNYYFNPTGVGDPMLAYYPMRADLKVLPGYYRVHSLSLTVKRCGGTEACVGGNNLTDECAINHVGDPATCARYTSLCRAGHTGHYCAVCKANHYRDSQKMCVPCTGSIVGGFAQLFAVMGVAFILLTLALRLRKYVTLSSAFKAKSNDELADALRPMIARQHGFQPPSWARQHSHTRDSIHPWTGAARAQAGPRVEGREAHSLRVQVTTGLHALRDAAQGLFQSRRSCGRSRGAEVAPGEAATQAGACSQEMVSQVGGMRATMQPRVHPCGWCLTLSRRLAPLPDVAWVRARRTCALPSNASRSTSCARDSTTPKASSCASPRPPGLWRCASSSRASGRSSSPCW